MRLGSRGILEVGLCAAGVVNGRYSFCAHVRASKLVYGVSVCGQ